MLPFRAEDIGRVQLADELEEQSASVTTGAEETAIEAPAGAVEEAVEAVAGDGGAVAAQPVTFDLSTDDGIRAAAEANPTLRGYFQKLQADAANAARQQREAEIRREQGTVERVQQYHQRLIGELQKDDADLDALARETPFFVKANEELVRAELLRAMLEQAAAHGDETAKELAQNLKGSPDEMVTVAQRAVDAAIKRARDEAYEQGKSEAATETAARLEAERKAAEVAARTAQVQNPPQASGSSPGAPGQPATERLNAMSDSAFASFLRTDPDAAKELMRQAREEKSRELTASRS